MKRVNEVTEELESMGSILAGMSRAMPYSVPAGYFEQLTVDSLQLTADSEQLPFGFAQDDIIGSKAMPFSVPQGYFEGLTGNIVAMAMADETLSISSKEMPFSVPTGYFDRLPAQMLQTAKIASPVKKGTVIPLIQRNTFRQVRWAAAAILVICISLGSYISFFSGGGQYQSGPEKMLASVPSEDIQDYLQHSYILDVNRIVNSSNNELNQIEEVENKDIIQYLNETGWDVVD